MNLIKTRIKLWNELNESNKFDECICLSDLPLSLKEIFELNFRKELEANKV